jgi:hypothetical protein
LTLGNKIDRLSRKVSKQLQIYTALQPRMAKSYKGHFTIILPSTPRSSQCLLPPAFPTKILYVFLTYPLSALCPTCLIFLHLIIPRLMFLTCKLRSSTQFSQSFCYFSSLGTDIILVSSPNLGTISHTNARTLLRVKYQILLACTDEDFGKVL